ncbi:MAG: hypothetical protein CM1200mP28_17910 [Deltaproteobacteria bacterium]|nr:MAG: hypothetical protein CM1200mP28_17910 [Deltaproteobacteria bacterium]
MAGGNPGSKLLIDFRSYFHALEKVRAGSLISLTVISVILSRLDFLKKITSTNYLTIQH